MNDCPYTKSGKWPDKELLAIIEEAVEEGNQKCLRCKVEGVYHGCAEVNWLECPRCGQQIGETSFN